MSKQHKKHTGGKWDLRFNLLSKVALHQRQTAEHHFSPCSLGDYNLSAVCNDLTHMCYLHANTLANKDFFTTWTTINKSARGFCATFLYAKINRVLHFLSFHSIVHGSGSMHVTNKTILPSLYSINYSLWQTNHNTVYMFKQSHYKYNITTVEHIFLFLLGEMYFM